MVITSAGESSCLYQVRVQSPNSRSSGGSYCISTTPVSAAVLNSGGYGGSRSSSQGGCGYLDKRVRDRMGSSSRPSQGGGRRSRLPELAATYERGASG